MRQTSPFSPFLSILIPGRDAPFPELELIRGDKGRGGRGERGALAETMKNEGKFNVQGTFLSSLPLFDPSFLFVFASSLPFHSFSWPSFSFSFPSLWRSSLFVILFILFRHSKFMNSLFSVSFFLFVSSLLFSFSSLSLIQYSSHSFFLLPCPYFSSHPLTSSHSHLPDLSFSLPFRHFTSLPSSSSTILLSDTN